MTPSRLRYLPLVCLALTAATWLLFRDRLAQAEGEGHAAARAELAVIDDAPAYAATVADASANLGPVDDAFSAGRRAGFLWLGIGLLVTVGCRAVIVRLRPSGKPGPAPGSRRAKLSLLLGGVAMVATALVGMYAESRGLAPVATAALGAIALYYGAADDPARGSKRAPDDAGEIEAP